MATVSNLVTSGAGGIDYTIGLGGSWDATSAGFSAGSETIDLTASAAKSDVVQAKDGAVSTYNGANGGVTAFTVDSQSASDKIKFAATKTIVKNATQATVNNVAGAATMAKKLDNSGALITKLANLAYTISNGVVTFGATGGHSLSEFTSGELMSAAQILVSSATTGGADKVLAFSSGGHSYVVASDNSVGGNPALQNGSGNLSTIIDLKDVASVKGFGSTFGEATVVSTDVNNLTGSAANNNGTAIDLTAYAASSTLDYDGFAIATLGAITGAASTNSTTFNNLAASALLNIDAVAGDHLGSITTNQVGTSGHNSLTVDMGTNASFIDTLTVNGDAEVFLSANAALQTITKLVDATNTMNTIAVQGNNALTLTEVSSTALTNIQAKDAGGAFTFGDATHIDAHDNLTINVAEAKASTILTSGANNTFTQNDGNGTVGTGNVTLTATGSSNTITLDNGANAITANGANDVITVGNGANTITATGSDTTTNISSLGADASTTLTVGTNAIVNIGSLDKAGNADQISANDVITVDAANTGGDSSNAAMTSINFETGVTAHATLDFNNAATDASVAYQLLGQAAGHGATAMATAQVNVESATTLAEALDLAANYTLLTQTQGTAASTANLAANTGMIDWFEYAGDTYVVGMANSTSVAVQQTALDSDDVVIKIAGLVDMSADTFNATTEQLVF